MRCLFILFTAFLLSSCSFYETPAKSAEIQETPTAEAAAPERQALYVYGQKLTSREITLHYGGEPLPLSCGYVRLVGTVNGVNEPIALLEIGGRGAACLPGDKVGEYKVVSINEREVELCSGK
jgi:hypothetical protein